MDIIKQLEALTTTDYKKNKKSNVVINNNEDKLNQFKREREKRKELNAMKQDIANLKDEIIKLTKIIEELSKKI